MPETTTAWSGFADYAPHGDAFDELVSARGSLREHGAPLVHALEALGPVEIAARLDAARRTIRDHDVTYNVYGDPRGMDRPWQLDIVPLVVSPAAWAGLERGLAQRARLLDLILADLYGAQRLLRDRLLPAPLVFANPGYLRPCHGLTVRHGRYLHLHAADLARTPDGAWWVLADRTQAPSGAGYALENRIVLSRSLPEPFRDCRVQRLAPFFRALRETLFALAPRPDDRRGQPRVVLLTAGPYNETYFEHAYLARYLGFALVEGGDLTVRDETVCLKTVDGLEPVDVVLRRLDDAFCDPLELRDDSSLGVAGLVQAARAGRVAIANALGSGVLESAALLPFLPGLCRHLLGEELLLPSVPTWWCGQARERQHVLDRLDAMVVKPAFAATHREPIFGATLSAREREALAAEIRARPYAYVGQQALALSTAPVWTGAGLEPRAIVVRAYATAHGDGYAVMPGGLTRVSSSTASTVVSTQSGGGSKDTWIVSDGPVSPVTLLGPPGGPVAVARAPKDLSSRVADNLFWLGRYAERSESLVRVFRASTSRLAESATLADAPELAVMVRGMVTMHLLPPAAAAAPTMSELEAILLDALVGGTRGGLRDTLGQLRHVAWLVRDRLSGDAWRILNQLHHDLRGDVRYIRAGDALVMLNRIVMTLAAFSGVEAENMTRGHGWRFLGAGRRLERAVALVTLIRAMLPANGSDDAPLWPLLEIGDSGMTYRRRYFAQASLAPVLDLLVADDSVPRSLAFQLQALAAHIDRFPRDAAAPASTREQALAARLLGAVRGADISSLCAARAGGRPQALDLLFAETARGLAELSDTITHYYFSHAVPRVSGR